MVGAVANDTRESDTENHHRPTPIATEDGLFANLACSARYVSHLLTSEAGVF
jgi:hypothetical protein